MSGRILHSIISYITALLSGMWIIFVWFILTDRLQDEFVYTPADIPGSAKPLPRSVARNGIN